MTIDVTFSANSVARLQSPAPGSAGGFFALFFAIICTVASSINAAPPTYPDHQDLSYYLRADGARISIRTPDEWQHRRAQIIAGMEKVMGPFPRPAKTVPLSVKLLEESIGD